MQSIAYYAHLDNTAGVALRTAAGTVHFCAETTGMWTDLTNRDIPRLVLHGHCATADSQALLDGNLVVKASRTLGRAA